ncbi:hypothetical protein Ae168Ps1_0810c [Pseudonocardia sp. Ae168_Ps1]|nr:MULTISPECIES: hypothetical protein [unclassified Pseudonocardia]OLL72432.1 hypothetical protein Ae150APs1_0810c [Pseudonocardia sp. Ae150A_Ps1]OLM18994.1 hypothetical protein Ae707Ps1_3253c [Pseudonocardia sp. Ae707_Ps1]OLL78404.1 hypothetical protein Ae168Ps1_0810c [Pseudonocardia sp. Ae168_Ps1]OLL87470.1 hypothetical protein Ae263Ps1_4525 [Pseudonocardia sp. Ae263_Ps1]OLL92501.1 hypothetical protein Ae356Ps1_2398c [Pseudonocardia sp. Ae356_Ps1]
MCRIFRHADPAAPTEMPTFSYRHLDGDPECTGAQQLDLGTGEVA